MIYHRKNINAFSRKKKREKKRVKEIIKVKTQKSNTILLPTTRQNQEIQLINQPKPN